MTMFEIYHHSNAGDCKGENLHNICENMRKAPQFQIILDAPMCHSGVILNVQWPCLHRFGRTWMIMMANSWLVVLGLGCLWVWLAILWTCSLLPSNMSLPFGTYIGRLSHWTTCRPANWLEGCVLKNISLSLSRAPFRWKQNCLDDFLLAKGHTCNKALQHSVPSYKNCRHLGPSHPVTRHRAQNPASFPSFLPPWAQKETNCASNSCQENNVFTSQGDPVTCTNKMLGKMHTWLHVLTLKVVAQVSNELSLERTAASSAEPHRWSWELAATLLLCITLVLSKERWKLHRNQVKSSGLGPLTCYKQFRDQPNLARSSATVWDVPNVLRMLEQFVQLNLSSFMQPNAWAYLQWKRAQPIKLGELGIQ